MTNTNTKTRPAHAARSERGPRYLTRAKIVEGDNLTHLIRAAKGGLHAARDLVGVYLSYYCGLRAQEIAGLEWKRHLLDARGNITRVVIISSDISKRGKARVLPIPSMLYDALVVLRKEQPKTKYVFHRLDGIVDAPLSANAVAQWFKRFYELHGFDGCSSHSGRRTFITQAARSAYERRLPISLRDVQALAGHSSLQTTADYIELSSNQINLVEHLYDKRQAA